MKKINILIFIMLIFAFILTGCSGSKASGVTEGVKVNKEDLKIKIDIDKEKRTSPCKCKTAFTRGLKVLY